MQYVASQRPVPVCPTNNKHGAPFLLQKTVAIYPICQCDYTMSYWNNNIFLAMKEHSYKENVTRVQNVCTRYIMDELQWNQKAVPKTKICREEVHFFRKSVQICAQITNCTSKKIYSRRSALLPGRFIRIFVFGTAFCCLT